MIDLTDLAVIYGELYRDGKLIDETMPSLKEHEPYGIAAPASLLLPHQTAISRFPTEIHQMIDSYVVGDQNLVPLEDLNAAGQDILTSFAFSRSLASVFLTDYARNRCIEMDSLQLAYMAPSTSHAGHHTFGKEKTILPVHDKRVRSIQITVILKMDHCHDPKAFAALKRLPKAMDRLSRAFTNLRNLTIKLEWAPELATLCPATIPEVLFGCPQGIREVVPFRRATIGLFDAVSRMKVPSKLLTFEHTPVGIDLSGLSRHSVMFKIYELLQQRIMTRSAAVSMLISPAFWEESMKEDAVHESAIEGQINGVQTSSRDSAGASALVKRYSNA